MGGADARDLGGGLVAGRWASRSAARAASSSAATPPLAVDDGEPDERRRRSPTSRVRRATSLSCSRSRSSATVATVAVSAVRRRSARRSASPAAIGAGPAAPRAASGAADCARPARRAASAPRRAATSMRTSGLLGRRGLRAQRVPLALGGRDPLLELGRAQLEHLDRPQRLAGDTGLGLLGRPRRGGRGARPARRGRRRRPRRRGSSARRGCSTWSAGTLSAGSGMRRPPGHSSHSCVGLGDRPRVEHVGAAPGRRVTVGARVGQRDEARASRRRTRAPARAAGRRRPAAGGRARGRGRSGRPRAASRPRRRVKPSGKGAASVTARIVATAARRPVGPPPDALCGVCRAWRRRPRRPTMEATTAPASTRLGGVGGPVLAAQEHLRALDDDLADELVDHGLSYPSFDREHLRLRGRPLAGEAPLAPHARALGQLRADAVGDRGPPRPAAAATRAATLTSTPR